MGEEVSLATPTRGVLARIGICLLNLLGPGFGLIRLGRYRAGFAFMGLFLALFCAVLAYYAAGPQVTYGSYLAIVGFVLLTSLALYCAATSLSWRRSRFRSPRTGWLWRWYGLLATFLALLVVLQLPVRYSHTHYRNFYAASASMAPTLEMNDRLLVAMRDFEPLKRGDIVIALRNEEEFVARIAGLPGDTIAMETGIVVLNGKPVPQRSAGEARPGGAIALHEQFPGEAVPHRILDDGNTAADYLSRVRLGENEYYLLGDNRDHAADSRFPLETFGLGVVPRERIVGRALFSYWRAEEGLGKRPL